MSLSNGIYYLKNLKTNQYLEATSTITARDVITTDDKDSVSYTRSHGAYVDHPWYLPRHFSVQRRQEDRRYGGYLYTIASLNKVLHVGTEVTPVSEKQIN
jgi:hypothetical protein